MDAAGKFDSLSPLENRGQSLSRPCAQAMNVFHGGADFATGSRGIAMDGKKGVDQSMRRRAVIVEEPFLETDVAKHEGFRAMFRGVRMEDGRAVVQR